MLELLTGCLQEGQSGDRTLGDLVERYKEQPPDSLKDQDIDPVAGNGFDDVIDRLSSLSMQCVSFKPKDHPTTATLIDELVACTLAVMEGRESSNDSILMPGSDVLPSNKCCLCARSMQLGIFCSSVDRHFVDHNCLEEHVVKHVNNHLGAPVPCPIEGCKSKHFDMDTLYGKISSLSFKLFQRVQHGNIDDNVQILALLREIASSSTGLAIFTIPSMSGVSESNAVHQQIQKLITTDFNKFYPKVIISYASGRRSRSDVSGAGLGLYKAAEVIKALFKSEIPCFSGLMTQAGKNWHEYFLRLDHKNARVLVVLLSKAPPSFNRLLVWRKCIRQLRKDLRLSLFELRNLEEEMVTLHVLWKVCGQTRWSQGMPGKSGRMRLLIRKSWA